MLNRFTIFYKNSTTAEVYESIKESGNGNLLLIDLSKQSTPSVFSYEAITGSDDYNEAIALFEQVEKTGVSNYLEKFKKIS